jgi:hypothetical protein
MTGGGHGGEETILYLYQQWGRRSPADDERIIPHYLPKACDSTPGWSKSPIVLGLLMLYQDEFVSRCHADGSLSWVVKQNILSPAGGFLKEDTPPDFLYQLCILERWSYKRLTYVFFMKSFQNHHTSVRVEVPIWTNFGYVRTNALKCVCSHNCIPIPYRRQ